MSDARHRVAESFNASGNEINLIRVEVWFLPGRYRGQPGRYELTARAMRVHGGMESWVFGHVASEKIADAPRYSAKTLELLRTTWKSALPSWRDVIRKCLDASGATLVDPSVIAEEAAA